MRHKLLPTSFDVELTINVFLNLVRLKGKEGYVETAPPPPPKKKAKRKEKLGKTTAIGLTYIQS